MNKTMNEKRNALLNEMDAIINSAETESRAMTEDETNRFAEIKAEITAIDATTKAAEESRSFERTASSDNESLEVKEERAFADFINGDKRALSAGANGVIIPTTISNRIIKKVKELSPIYSMATVFNVGGKLAFPVEDESTGAITAAYVDEFDELTENTGKFTTITLDAYIIGTLAKISKSLINRTDIDVVSYVVNKVAESIAELIESEALTGDTKMEGVFTSKNVVTAASSTAITADELIDLQVAVPTCFQNNACWIMSKSVLKSIRKLKDNDGNYLLNKDVTRGFGWELLGRPVYVSDNAPAIAADTAVIAYGDMSGLYIKLAQNVEIQMLMEKYATQHAIGVCGYAEIDSKIVEPDKLAVLKMAK